VQIGGEPLSNAILVSRSEDVGLALKSDSTVVGWGANSFGDGKAVGYATPGVLRTNGLVRIKGEILTNVVSICAAREFSLALKKDGTVVAWGGNYVPPGLSNVVGIAAEWHYSWALRQDGTVVGWAANQGSHDYDRLIETKGLSNIVAIAVGSGGNGTHGVALRNDGTVTHWGVESIDNGISDIVPPPNLSNVVAVAAGYNYSLALTKDGAVIGWGHNQTGQATGVPTRPKPNGTSVSSGVVTIDGQILTNVISIAAYRETSMALKKDGTVVTWGGVPGIHPVTIPEGLTNVIAIAAGADSLYLAITTNAAVAERFRNSERN
jgi:alpha-tubulin suppressor-like RCC1 family protein